MVISVNACISGMFECMYEYILGSIVMMHAILNIYFGLAFIIISCIYYYYQCLQHEWGVNFRVTFIVCSVNLSQDSIICREKRRILAKDPRPYECIHAIRERQQLRCRNGSYKYKDNKRKLLFTAACSFMIGSRETNTCIFSIFVYPCFIFIQIFVLQPLLFA